MSNLKWRTDVENLNNGQNCIAIVRGPLRNKIARVEWCGDAKRFWHSITGDYIQSHVMAFLTDDFLIESFNEQQPTTGERP